MSCSQHFQPRFLPVTHVPPTFPDNKMVARYQDHEARIIEKLVSGEEYHLEFWRDYFLPLLQTHPDFFPKWFQKIKKNQADGDEFLHNPLFAAVTALLAEREPIKTFLATQQQKFMNLPPLQKEFLLAVFAKTLSTADLTAFIQKNLPDETTTAVLQKWGEILRQEVLPPTVKLILLEHLLKNKDRTKTIFDFSELLNLIEVQQLPFLDECPASRALLLSLPPDQAYHFLERSLTPPDEQFLFQNRVHLGISWWLLKENRTTVAESWPQICQTLQRGSFWEISCWQKVRDFLDKEGANLVSGTQRTYRQMLLDQLTLTYHGTTSILLLPKLLALNSLTKSEIQQIQAAKEKATGYVWLGDYVLGTIALEQGQTTKANQYFSDGWSELCGWSGADQIELADWLPPQVVKQQITRTKKYLQTILVTLEKEKRVFSNGIPFTLKFDGQNTNFQITELYRCLALLQKNSPPDFQKYLTMFITTINPIDLLDFTQRLRFVSQPTYLDAVSTCCWQEIKNENNYDQIKKINNLTKKVSELTPVLPAVIEKEINQFLSDPEQCFSQHPANFMTSCLDWLARGGINADSKESVQAVLKYQQSNNADLTVFSVKMECDRALAALILRRRQLRRQTTAKLLK